MSAVEGDDHEESPAGVFRRARKEYVPAPVNSGSDGENVAETPVEASFQSSHFVEPGCLTCTSLLDPPGGAALAHVMSALVPLGTMTTFTETVPFIVSGAAEWYGYRPAARKSCENPSPAAFGPESNSPVSDVTVWELEFPGS